MEPDNRHRFSKMPLAAIELDPLETEMLNATTLGSYVVSLFARHECPAAIPP